MEQYLKTYILLFFLLPFGLSAQELRGLDNQGEQDSTLQYIEELAYLQPGEAIGRATAVQRYSLDIGDSALYADALQLNATAQFRLYNFKNAANLLNEALGVYQKLNDTTGIVKSLTGLAEIEAYTGHNYQALTKLERALGLAQKINAERESIQIYYLLSLIRLHQQQSDKALEYAQSGLKLANQLNEKAQRGTLYNLLAKVKLAQNDVSKAEAYLKNAKLIHRGLGKEAEIAESHAVSARIAYRNGNYSQAQEEIGRAMVLSKKQGHPYQYAEHLLIYSKILGQSGNQDEALRVIQTADSIAGRHKQIEYLKRDITAQLADVYMITGDSARALRNLIEYNAIDDSIREFDFQKMLLKREFENEKAQNHELSQKNEFNEQLIERSKLLLLLACGLIVAFVLLIAALMQNISRKRKYGKHLLKKNELIREKSEAIKSQQEELEEKNKKLEELDQTKNKIFSVLTHDLRQPITQVKSVLNLLEAEELSDEDRIAMVGQLKDSIDNSSNSLENLLLWSKKQMTGITTKIVDIHLLPQVWQLESQIKPNLQSKNLKFNIKVPDFFKIQADMNQLDICMRNLVNNSIKFVNPGGKITLEAFEKGDYNVVQVRDNGVGMEPDQLEKLQKLSESFSTIGTMNEKGTGLGILIVHEFMENQNGTLQIDSEKGKGSKFSLVFPKHNKDYRGKKSGGEAKQPA